MVTNFARDCKAREGMRGYHTAVAIVTCAMHCCMCSNIHPLASGSLTQRHMLPWR